METVAIRRAAQRASRAEAQAKQAINAAIELFHRRWVLRILWELRAGPLTFRALRGRCDEISPTVLNQRLHELREAALVLHEEGAGYRLSDRGEELLVAMRPLLTWAQRWHAAASG